MEANRLIAQVYGCLRLSRVRPVFGRSFSYPLSEVCSQYVGLVGSARFGSLIVVLIFPGAVTPPVSPKSGQECLWQPHNGSSRSIGMSPAKRLKETGH